MLHVMNGDSTRLTFEASGMPGDAIVYADALLEGPVPADLTDAAMQTVRERFWQHAAPPEEGAASRASTSLLDRWQQDLDRYSQYDEVVLWFEYDLFDQLLLIRHLDWFARRDRRATRVSLICVGEFPGIAGFKGLGQLTPVQLASLLDTRTPVTDAHLALGGRAWRAFTSPEPTAIERLLASDTGGLPFLAPALRRWLEEFPAVGSGLPRSEQEILSILDERPRPIESLWRAWLQREQTLMPTDTALISRLECLAAGANPLVSVRRESRDCRGLKGTAARTDTGRDVLAGRADWVRLTPFDRWMGGVHLTNGSMWRWDPARGRLQRPEGTA